MPRGRVQTRAEASKDEPPGQQRGTSSDSASRRTNKRAKASESRKRSPPESAIEPAEAKSTQAVAIGGKPPETGGKKN